MSPREEIANPQTSDSAKAIVPVNPQAGSGIAAGPWSRAGWRRLRIYLVEMRERDALVKPPRMNQKIRLGVTATTNEHQSRDRSRRGTADEDEGAGVKLRCVRRVPTLVTPMAQSGLRLSTTLPSQKALDQVFMPVPNQ
jgi:hypothetical protein